MRLSVSLHRQTNSLPVWRTPEQQVPTKSIHFNSWKRQGITHLGHKTTY
uniref:Uncharacterized protein n=1 Tax=Anguilla anguilla TaxID=7936 RepID=A0A0E9R5H8_ANGAN